MAFWQIEPFGSSFNEYLSALVASTVAEVNRNRKKRGRSFTPKEFMVDWAEATAPKKEQSAESMLEFIKGIQAELEIRHGKRRPEDRDKPVLVDQHGRPLG